MTTVLKSLVVSAMGNYFGLALQIVSTMVLARLLTPAETGIFAVAAAFAALASTFRDFGIAEYLIQEKERIDVALKAAYAVNIVVSWAMALLLLGTAPLASAFYGNEGVGDVMQVQAVAFLLIPFGALTMAWFRRQMNFTPIVITGIAADAVACVVALVLAMNGFSYMSLAWSALAGAVVTVGFSLYLRPAAVPAWPSFKGARRVIEFGRFATGIYVLGQAGKGAPEMIVGRALNMAEAGIFSRAQGLVDVFHRLVLRAVMPICLPYFANNIRETGHLKAGLLQITSYLSVIGWTAFGAIALTVYSLVHILYGEQWLEAVELAQLLCAVAALELLYFPSKEALLALGRAREANRLQMFIQGLRVLGLLAAIPFGLIGACFGLLVASVLGASAAVYALARVGQLDASSLSRSLAHSGVVALLALAPGAVVVWVYPPSEDAFVASAIASWLAVCAAWPVALLATRHPLWRELCQIAATLSARMRLAFR